MNISLVMTKVFAFFSLFFAIFNSVAAQTDSSIYQLANGTRIRVRMDNEINSKVSSENDTFTVKISEPLKVRDSVVLPIGTVIEGRVTKVRRAALGGRNGNLEVAFETLEAPDGERQKIRGVLVNRLNAESSLTANVLTVAGGTAIGAIVGAAAKSSSGAFVGAGVGAGAGAGLAFLRKGREVKIKTDEEFEIQLIRDVMLPVEDY